MHNIYANYPLYQWKFNAISQKVQGDQQYSISRPSESENTKIQYKTTFYENVDHDSTLTNVESDIILKIHPKKHVNPTKFINKSYNQPGTRSTDQFLNEKKRCSDSLTKMIPKQDMTPLERIHLKRLVYEKNRRNHVARMNHEDANWTIRGGVICQKTSC